MINSTNQACYCHQTTLHDTELFIVIHENIYISTSKRHLEELLKGSSSENSHGLNLIFWTLRLPQSQNCRKRRVGSLLVCLVTGMILDSNGWYGLFWSEEQRGQLRPLLDPRDKFRDQIFQILVRKFLFTFGVYILQTFLHISLRRNTYHSEFYQLCLEYGGFLALRQAKMRVQAGKSEVLGWQECDIGQAKIHYQASDSASRHVWAGKSPAFRQVIQQHCTSSKEQCRHDQAYEGQYFPEPARLT